MTAGICYLRRSRSERFYIIETVFRGAQTIIAGTVLGTIITSDIFSRITSDFCSNQNEGGVLRIDTTGLMKKTELLGCQSLSRSARHRNKDLLPDPQ